MAWTDLEYVVNSFRRDYCDKSSIFRSGEVSYTQTFPWKTFKICSKSTLKLLRYLVVGGGVRMLRLTQVLERLYPGGSMRASPLVAPRWIAARLAPVLAGVGRDFIEANWGPPPNFSTTKAAEELGLRNWVPLEASLYDMVEGLADKGLLRHPLATDDRCMPVWGAAGGGRGARKLSTSQSAGATPRVNVGVLLNAAVRSPSI